MVKDQYEARPTMHGPATYRVRVVGHLDAGWSGRLEGMNLSESIAADDDSVTILEGRLADQAALSGVLDTLYQLRLPVLSVECLENE